MPFPPQRFIHAANVRLDVPVSVYLSEQLTDELRELLEDATLLSFDCVIDQCIGRKVDYLLLSGNVFVESDRSLRARLSLLKGFRRLREHRIPVCVIPGDTDPAEAWRAIPELPDNVYVCFSSSPEPIALERRGRTIMTITASTWYGETDAFGIRVIHASEDGIEPLRIGTVSRAKYDESRRMASLTTASDDSLLQLEEDPDAAQPPTSKLDETPEEYEAGFRSYIQRLMREARLNYLALGSELDRTHIELETGMVHCPGTTQPRNRLEASFGVCTVIEVAADGITTCEEIDTSAVDWKDVTLRLSADTELNELLEEMRDSLLKMTCGPSDRIWSVCWTLTGPVPIVQAFIEDDLELAVAVELDELSVGNREIRLLHQVKTLPDAWDLDDPDHLAQQYGRLIPPDSDIARSELLAFLEDSELSEGWARRLEALARGVDSKRLLAQLRMDGVDWFIDDVDELLRTDQDDREIVDGIDDDDHESDVAVQRDVATAVMADDEEDDNDLADDELQDA